MERVDNICPFPHSLNGADIKLWPNLYMSKDCLPKVQALFYQLDCILRQSSRSVCSRCLHGLPETQQYNIIYHKQSDRQP